MNLLTSSEMAKKWGISSRRIAILCSEGRIAGAVKKGKHGLYLLMYRSLQMQDVRIQMIYQKMD